jgi:hypothetical protein
MRWGLVALALAAIALAACGGGKKAGATKPPQTTRPAAAASVRVTITATTHTPKVNAPWPVRIGVTDARGKPLAARLTMQILLNGAPVGKVDNGAVYRFIGTWQEKKGQEITWPPESRGQPFALEAVVTAKGGTVKKTWAVTPR